MSYFDFIPQELINEILYYNNVEDIETVINIFDLSLDKYFWINKLNHEGFSDLIKYFDFIQSDNNLSDSETYRSLLDADISADNFIKSFDKFSAAMMTIRVSDDTDVKYMLNKLDINYISAVIKVPKNFNKYIEIYHETHRNANNYNFKLGTFTAATLNKKEFKSFLIILVLIGLDLADLSNLEELYAELYEDYEY